MTEIPSKQRGFSVEKMLDLSQEQIAKWLLCAFLWGVALGVFYDGIRAFKMLCGISCGETETQKKHTLGRIIEYAVTFLCDIVFWVTVGVLSILLMYRMGGGFFRGITYVGLGAGFALYYFTVGTVVLKFSRFAVRLLKKVVKKAFSLLIFPVKKLFFALIALYRLTIGKFLGKIIEEIKISKQNKKKTEDTENLTEENDSGGEEEFVYVDGKIGYKKQGRISFGSNRADR